MSSTVMMSAAVRSSFLVFLMRPIGRAGSSPGSPFTSGITATPVSNPDKPSASLGKDDQGGRQHHHGIAVRLHEPVAPPGQILGMMRDLEEAPADQHDVQRQINRRR